MSNRLLDTSAAVVETVAVQAITRLLTETESEAVTFCFPPVTFARRCRVILVRNSRMAIKLDSAQTYTLLERVHLGDRHALDDLLTRYRLLAAPRPAPPLLPPGRAFLPSPVPQGGDVGPQW
jgi:hypothetical protein